MLLKFLIKKKAMLIFRSDHEDCKLLPIASSLDLRVVAAPALTQTISSAQVEYLLLMCLLPIEMQTTVKISDLIVLLIN